MMPQGREGKKMENRSGGNHGSQAAWLSVRDSSVLDICFHGTVLAVVLSAMSPLPFFVFLSLVLKVFLEILRAAQHLFNKFLFFFFSCLNQPELVSVV